MADSAQNTPALQISLPPNEILINVVQTLNGRVDDLTSEMNVYTTCNTAIRHVQNLLENRDRPLTLRHIRTWQERQKLREFAQFITDQNPPPGPLSIRNALPASQLPPPKRATAEERRILKQNFSKEPFIMTHASVEDKKLATVPGSIRLSAIDGVAGSPSVEIFNDNCLWDTGSQVCSISADLVMNKDPSFLDMKIHDPYRMHSNICVQVDAILSLSNKTFEISAIFLVLPSANIPNKRAGVILGQHGFIDRLITETIPRSILLKRGKEVEETVWGEIHIKAKLDLYEELEEFN